ncbi:NDR1/HIN1-like protein 6 [Cornus florida]|uniref:NDR1/HIN1-like protein 6 n=1 Tax=Cornus florida TaxID=4283 RepID=UPI00289D0ECD|nr:NDR1/HIN1-like protein 6 [Cornus florida]
MNAPPPQQQYVMLQQGSNQSQPPFRRSIPPYNHPSHRRKGSCCLRCICFCFCFIFVLILILFGAIFYFYNVYAPKMPIYQVEDLNVKSFNFVHTDSTVNTEFLVTVKAENPNKNIEFVYGENSSVVVSYTDNALCSGKLPDFRQGHMNTTLMKVTLTGKSKLGPGMQEALMKTRDGGSIPLLVRVQVPIKVIFGEFPLRQFMVYANCSLVVQNLAPNQKTKILNSKYSFDFSF